jgi:hypothetical protein
MKVTLVETSGLGPAGATLEGPEVWRHCFPGGSPIRALPADAEAEAAVEAELNTVHGLRREHLISRMRAARDGYLETLAVPAASTPEDPQSEPADPQSAGKKPAGKKPAG